MKLLYHYKYITSKDKRATSEANMASEINNFKLCTTPKTVAIKPPTVALPSWACVQSLLFAWWGPS